MKKPNVMADPSVYKIKVKTTSEPNDPNPRADLGGTTFTSRTLTPNHCWNGFDGTPTPASDNLTPVLTSGASTWTGDSQPSTSTTWTIDNAPCILASNAHNYYLSFTDDNPQSEIEVKPLTGSAASSIQLSDLNYTGARSCS